MSIQIKELCAGDVIRVAPTELPDGFQPIFGESAVEVVITDVDQENGVLTLARKDSIPWTQKPYLVVDNLIWSGSRYYQITAYFPNEALDLLQGNLSVA